MSSDEYESDEDTKKKGSKDKKNKRCRKKFCGHCLKKFYKENANAIPDRNCWKCPSCRKICCCAACRRRKTKEDDAAMGKKSKSKSHSHHKVAHQAHRQQSRPQSQHSRAAQNLENISRSRYYRHQVQQQQQQQEEEESEESDEEDDSIYHNTSGPQYAYRLQAARGALPQHRIRNHRNTENDDDYPDDEQAGGFIMNAMSAHGGSGITPLFPPQNPNQNVKKFKLGDMGGNEKPSKMARTNDYPVMQVSPPIYGSTHRDLSVPPIPTMLLQTSDLSSPMTTPLRVPADFDFAPDDMSLGPTTGDDGSRTQLKTRIPISQYATVLTKQIKKHAQEAAKNSTNSQFGNLYSIAMTPAVNKKIELVLARMDISQNQKVEYIASILRMNTGANK